MEHIGVRAGGHKARHERILEHIGTAPGVLADDDPGGTLLHGAALLGGVGPFFIVIPPQETAHLVGVVCGQIDVGFPRKPSVPK